MVYLRVQPYGSFVTTLGVEYTATCDRSVPCGNVNLDGRTYYLVGCTSIFHAVTTEASHRLGGATL
jgi:hypothetical protein